MRRKKYKVTGMSCAACAARVEKAVSGLDGVESCAVNLLTGDMGVEGEVSSAEVVHAVEAAGYGAHPEDDSEAHARPTKDVSEDGREIRSLRARLIASVAFLLPLMYISMGHVMWGWPLFAPLAGDPLALGMLELLLTGAVLLINQRFFVSGTRSLLHGAPNMDTLVALGAAAAFGYSTVVLFGMSGMLVNGDTAGAAHGLHGLYFESAAMILTLITLGKMLEAYAKGRTTDALQSLLALAPETATVLRGEKEQVLPIAEVRRGDIMLIRPGESIPADGVVVAGTSAVNESALTGESIPVDKEEGDRVSAATLNLSGFLRCEVTEVGEETALARIIRTVSDAAATKAPIAKVADRVSGIFVPVVIFLGLLSGIAWLIAGAEPGYALARAISVLVISCPCALGLATPVAIMVGSGVGARHGVLFKTAESLEETGRARVVVLDKTGTVTEGAPRVTDVLPAPGVPGEELLYVAASLEKKSEHPLARAVMEWVEERGTEGAELSDFSVLPGNGLRGFCGSEEFLGGKAGYVATRVALPDTALSAAEELSENGKTPLYFARAGRYLGMIAVADVLRADTPAAVAELRRMGLSVVMLTGDNERTARAIGRAAGIDEIVAGVLPEGKADVVRRLHSRGKVMMVGDGINDAPALTEADTGVAIGAGTDVAVDAADVVLMQSRLSDVVTAIRLSRATLRNIRENLFWAFFYNLIGIPLAAGLFIPLFGWELDPMFGAAAMSLSSFCVVMNALRLHLFRIRAAGDSVAVGGMPATADACKAAAAWTQQPEIQKQMPAPDTEAAKKEERMKQEKMSKELHVTGMMCANCEAHVRKALEALPGVAAATADHTTGMVHVELTAEVSESALRAAIEEEGYHVTD